MIERAKGRPILSLAHLTMMDAAPVELVEAAAAGGFNAVGLRVVPPMPTDKLVPVVGDEAMIRSIEQRLANTGVRVHDIEAIWLSPHTNVKDLDPALEVGARLGAKHVLSVGFDTDLGRLRANLAALCEMAGSFGMGVVLEPISFAEIKTIGEALATLDAVGAPNATLLVDALHFFRMGGRTEDLAAVDPNRLPYLHLCDAPLAHPGIDGLRPEGRSGRSYPGQGELPLVDFVRAFPKGTTIVVEAPCRDYANLTPVERGRLCGEVTHAFVDTLYGENRDR
jgi:sugar phosphate isomerase/epimerase